MVALDNCWTYCQFNDRKIQKKNIRTDLETRILKTSLKEQYAKLGGMKEANAIETTPKTLYQIMWLILPRL
jgi:hypothetical protein